jgi:hypothetical protein
MKPSKPAAAPASIKVPTYWQSVFRSYHEKRKREMKKTLDELQLGFRPLDFRSCLFFVRKFTKMDYDGLAVKIGIEPTFLRALERRNAVDVDTYDKLRDIAHDYYLPESIENWFNSEARIKESKRRPMRAETLGGERI